MIKRSNFKKREEMKREGIIVMKKKLKRAEEMFREREESEGKGERGEKNREKEKEKKVKRLKEKSMLILVFLHDLNLMLMYNVILEKMKAKIMCAKKFLNTMRDKIIINNKHSIHLERR